MVKLAVFAALVLVLIITTEAAINGDCPLSSQHTSCSPKCLQNHECAARGEICCPNLCNASSCTRPKVGGSSSGGIGGGSSSGNYKGSQGTGNICGNVKCLPNERCASDRSTSRPKCMRI